jgi:hypothetical protein
MIAVKPMGDMFGTIVGKSSSDGNGYWFSYSDIPKSGFGDLLYAYGHESGCGFCFGTSHSAGDLNGNGSGHGYSREDGFLGNGLTEFIF